MPAASRNLPSCVKVGAVLVVLVLVALLGVGCSSNGSNSSHSYPEASKKLFMDNCLKGRFATRTYCQCALDELQARYTYREFAEIEKGLDAGGADQRDAEQKLIDVVQKCQP